MFHWFNGVNGFSGFNGVVVFIHLTDFVGLMALMV